MPYGIHWFRRDLRLTGNPALEWLFQAHPGKVVGLFIFDREFLARRDFSHARFQFFLKTLESLRDDLREIGSDLLFLDTGPMAAIPKLLKSLSEKPALFSWNRDYEPFAVKRDAKVETILREHGVSIHTERDHLLIEPPEIYKGEDPQAGYQVFTPFAKKWHEVFKTPDVQSRVAQQLKRKSFVKSALNWNSLLPHPPEDSLKRYLDTNAKHVSIPLPEAGEEAAQKAVLKFKLKMSGYANHRDYPAEHGTSGFSIFLKNGSLTTAQVIGRLPQAPNKFVSELIWREFYYHILARHPRVENGAFLEKYANLDWENRKDWFQAWCEGKTGFPIIDAGMRQLNQTGWMHNRVRMIVASFLTKDLLIDWRWGERYFMEKLIDGDLAPNNGGWQWAASTGCDPQPYFRVFNPVLQGKRFDPQGEYVKKYVPEIRNVPLKQIHEPLPSAIVDHSVQRLLAVKLYQR